MLEAAEQAALQGHWAVGFVAYEAARGLAGQGLPVQLSRGDQPLVAFGIYREPGWVERLPVPGSHPQLGSLRSRWSREEYVERVERIRNGILQGEFYQINLTFPLAASLYAPSEELFFVLAEQSCAEGAAFLAWDWGAVLCLSPELFFDRDGERLRMAPMKGTRIRGRYLAEDQRFAGELRNSEKEQAENLMILDMVRNDLGRLATPGSVEVVERFRLEPYPTVWQMTSVVEARSDARLLELFEALFPCASVTGAPKRAAMAAIAELEVEPRGAYTGAIGWIAPGRRARFAVGIRTAEILGDEARFGVGSGITWDSDPLKEWEECWAKARVLEPWPEFALLETLRWEPAGGFPMLQDHWNRLAASAAHFGFVLEERELKQRLQDAVASEREPRRVRLQLKRDGSVKIETAPFEPARGPWRLVLASERVNPSDRWLFHKTTLRERYERALLQARALGAQEAIFVNVNGFLTEGTRTNLLVRLEGRWWTPPLDSGLLPGIYRQRLLQAGRVAERPLTLGDLGRAQGLAVVNALRGWIPAVWNFLEDEGVAR